MWTWKLVSRIESSRLFGDLRFKFTKKLRGSTLVQPRNFFVNLKRISSKNPAPVC